MWVVWWLFEFIYQSSVFYLSNFLFCQEAFLLINNTFEQRQCEHDYGYLKKLIDWIE